MRRGRDGGYGHERKRKWEYEKISGVDEWKGRVKMKR